MNPSASGWIPKFLTLVEKQRITNFASDEFQFYKESKNVGFIYGISIESLPNKPLSKLTFTTVEYTKINLFHSLLFAFFIKNKNADTNDAITSIIDFYKELEKGKTSFLYKLSISKSPTDILEHVLASRLQENNKISKKKENKILPNSLLFLDILAYRKYLISKENIKLYEQELESNIINFCFLALKAKKEKDKFDLQIIDQMEDSSAYLTLQNNQNQFLSIESLYRQSNLDKLEKNYIFDLCCLAVWNDKELDVTEHLFLKKLTQILQISEDCITKNLHFIRQFSEKHSKSLKLFEHTNPLNQLYKHSTDTVKLLILRNKNRLIKELNESGELVKLLGQSTLRELSTEEKDKVKEQLLDVCKTVPSLTIFLIPGGSLLLPILVKYIPSLLPSAFNENRIDSSKNKQK